MKELSASQDWEEGLLEIELFPSTFEKKFLKILEIRHYIMRSEVLFWYSCRSELYIFPIKVISLQNATLEIIF